MEKTQNLISIILSFRNEKEIIPELIRRLKGVLDPLPEDYELIFVNDASTDRSRKILEDYHRDDPRIIIINMSRRFGVEECIWAGLEYARGDAAVYMDADLQDPPEEIPRLIEEWKKGADVVYTVRTARRGEKPFRMWATRLAYRLIRAASPEVDLEVEASLFRLVSRRVVEELLKLKERNPYLRGLVPWVGFKQVPVYYERQSRPVGSTHFPILPSIFRDLSGFRGPFGTFILGLTSFSFLPLLIFLYLGILLVILSLGVLTVIGVLALTGSPVSGFVALLLFQFFLAGLGFLGLGVIGIYLGRVFNEVRGRPRYIVSDTIGSDSEGERPSPAPDEQG